MTSHVASPRRGRPLTLRPGRPLPLGLQETCDGVNLAVFSRHAERVTLLVYVTTHPEQPPARHVLDPAVHRTGDIWHAALAGDLADAAYAYEVQGPWSPAEGHRFDGTRALVDPCSRMLTAAVGESTTAPRARLALEAYDWEGDRPLRLPWTDLVVYETHARGLTRHPSAGVAAPGTYRAVIEKIPHLRALGVSALELLPVQAHSHRAARSYDPLTGAPLRNYWGYDPVALFAVEPAYATTPCAARDECRDMIKALHRAGIEVWLDVVFNHTAEGGTGGPTLSFRGFDNAIYYMLDRGGRYRDYTGCGNTLNCNHVVVRSLIIDCLRAWVAEMHVDGFRFDLAAVLGRGLDGRVLSNPPLLDEIAEDPVLRGTKLIAEAWDAGGAFQVGTFADGWAEWNCHFRHDVRRFWRGDPGFAGALAARLCGSADLYERQGATPLRSLNFVTSHDGFTLADLSSYARKHNRANGEDDRDGANENFSTNFGVEGDSDDSGVQTLRRRHARNCLATLFLSRGVPMLLGGDEFGRTQRGNNNAYCQDNEISWYDWSLAERNAERLRFTMRLAALRRAHPVLRAERFYTGADVHWIGPHGRAPDWQGADNAFGVRVAAERALLLLFNGGAHPQAFMTSASPDAAWQLALDTALDGDDESAPRMQRGSVITLQPQSLQCWVAAA